MRLCRKDYYQLLGLQKGVDERLLKKAYRKLALKYHPVRAACLSCNAQEQQHISCTWAHSGTNAQLKYFTIPVASPGFPRGMCSAVHSLCQDAEF